jgi:hypothetical protein
MSGIGPGESPSEPQLNQHDLLSPRADYGYDAAVLQQQRDSFAEGNPGLMARLHLAATQLVRLQENPVDHPRHEIQMPLAHRLEEGVFPGTPDDPLMGIQLALDHQVKALTGDRYFVHDIDPIFFGTPAFAQTEWQQRRYVTLGLVSRTDERGKAKLDSPFALAVSYGGEYARIVPRVSEDVLAQRRDQHQVDEIVEYGRSGASPTQRSHMRQLRGDLRDLILRPNLSRYGNLALVRILGSDVLTNLTATPSQHHDVLRGLRTTTRDTSYIPEDVLFTAFAALRHLRAYDSPEES